MSMRQLRQKETCCTRVSAANTFNLQQVSDDVDGCVQVGANWPNVRRCWSEDEWGASYSKATACNAWDLCRILNAMLLLLLTEREIQSIWNDRYQSWFHFTTSLAPTAQIWTRLTTKDGRNAAAGLPSSWRRCTEAALGRRLAYFWAKRW